MLRQISAAAIATGMAAALAGDLRAEAVASYKIACRYDEEKRSLEGNERLAWRNPTSRPAALLRFELHGNQWRNNRSTFWREARAGGVEPEARDGAWGSLSVSRMTDASGNDLLERMRFVSPDDGNPDDRTVLEVPLEHPVPAGATILLDIDFVARLPRLGSTGGWKGSFVLASDWFPSIGVLDGTGWRAHQAHAGSGTFSDDADFDVVVDLPAKFRGKAAGTGRLVEERDAPRDRVLEHFRAESVPGFAWAADPGFDVDGERVPNPGGPDLALTLLCQPEHRIYRPRFLRAAKIGLAELQKRIGPFPYPSLAIVDIPWGAGGALRVAAPGFVSGRTSLLSPDGVWQEGSPEAIVLGGIAGQWFEEAAAPDPFERPRLDRALSRYFAARIDRSAFGNSRGVLPLFGYPVVIESVEIRPDPGFRAEANPPRLEAALATFERTAGQTSSDAVLSSFFAEFRQRHPLPGDFLSVVKRQAGPSWEGFFRSVILGGSVDFAVTRASSVPSIPPIGLLETDGRTSEVSVSSAARRSGYDTEVFVARRGDAVVPVEIRLDFEGGRVYRTVWNGESVWLRLRVENGPRLRRAIADPDSKVVIDANRNNNGLTVRGDAAAANLWTARAFFWSENLLDLFMELW